jgi:hypothetical protein
MAYRLFLTLFTLVLANTLLLKGGLIQLTSYFYNRTDDYV